MNFYSALFPLPNSFLLNISLALGVSGIVLSYRRKHTAALICLIICGFLLRIFMAHLDPYLHEWDERFQALVARHMMVHPFAPMLMQNDWLQYDYTQWSTNHIWLHKQPLFLWQMALSMKMFGATVYATRYPAAVMQTIGIWFVYRIAFLMSGKRQLAFIAALLACFSYYQIELVSGYLGMDQNDAAFDFYVLATFWAYAEYATKERMKYVILIGVFAGCAVLNKWLTGMLVFSGWGVVLLFNMKKEGFRKQLLHYLIALLVAAIVFVPWQVYTLYAFPAEARYELAYNGKHVFEVVEGHVGSNWYYVNEFWRYFGNYLWYLVPLGLILVIVRKEWHNKISTSLTLCLVFSFVFFSFIVQTKMPSYLMIAAPIGLIWIAISVHGIAAHERLYKWLYVPVLAIAAMVILNLPSITTIHDLRNERSGSDPCLNCKVENNKVFRSLNQYIPPTVHIVMNVKDYVDCMFYNPDVDAYGWMLSEENMKRVRERHAPVAVFHVAGETLPYYIAGYDSLYIIPVRLK